MIGNKFFAKRGFTIVELIIYMGLLSILLAVVTEIFLSILDLQNQSTAVSNVSQDGKYIISRLGYDIRRSSEITVPASTGVKTENAALTIDGEAFTYTASSSGGLVITQNSGSDYLTSNETRISNLSFTRLGNAGGKNSLMISFTLTGRQALKNSYETRDYQTVISLR